ncbi:hypothetical protein [Collinsella provencensis]|uniref:hypothetical protein n=1 Tax=Collinsella provencensis TaxID=1937461 RepID=UPI000C8548F3|nr:hypothetical protein [Collinsella provencensis]
MTDPAQLPAPDHSYDMEDHPVYEPVYLMDYVVRYKWIAVAVLLVLALVSAIPLRGVFMSPETYSSTIATLDEKKDTVLALTAASAGTSAAISALPGDAGSPIAEKLMDLSADFMIVLAAIYLEKYLLTTFGFVAFAILFPAACLMFIGSILTYGRLSSSGMLARMARKVTLLGIVLIITVPSSVMLTNQIEATFDDSINQTVAQAEDVMEEAEGSEEKEDEGQLGLFGSLTETVGDGLSAVTGGAKDMLNHFIESLAIMLVTSCVIPILVLLFFLWAANLILGINVEAPMRAVRPRTFRGKSK